MNGDALGAFSEDTHEEYVWCGVEHFLAWKEAQP